MNLPRRCVAAAAAALLVIAGVAVQRSRVGRPLATLKWSFVRHWAPSC
jgi:hypothetical protein